jgi:hypothetical protein
VTPAQGSAGSVRERSGAITAIHAPVSVGEHATGKAEISAQESTVVARFYGEAVLQRRVLDCLPAVLSSVVSTKEEARRAKEGTSAEINRCAAAIRAAVCGWWKVAASASAKRLNLCAAGFWASLLHNMGRKR